MLTSVTPRKTLLFLEGAPVYLSRNLLGNLACSVFGRETEILVLSVQALQCCWCGASPTFLREACPGPSPRLCVCWARAVCGLGLGVIGDQAETYQESAWCSLGTNPSGLGGFPWPYIQTGELQTSLASTWEMQVTWKSSQRCWGPCLGPLLGQRRSGEGQGSL